MSLHQKGRVAPRARGDQAAALRPGRWRARRQGEPVRRGYRRALLNTYLRAVSVELKAREQLELIERLEALEEALESRSGRRGA
jgi:hypothetical protein